MIGKKRTPQRTVFIPGTLSDYIPEDHVLKRVNAVLDLGWLREEVRDCYDARIGRASIDPEAALRLMLAGFFQGIVHDRKLMRQAEVDLAIRWFARYELGEELPEHSSRSACLRVSVLPRCGGELNGSRGFSSARLRHASKPGWYLARRCI